MAAALPELRRRALLRETSCWGSPSATAGTAGRLGWTGGRAYYGDRLGRSPSSRSTSPTGTGSSRHRRDLAAGPSETLADDLYDGQTIDARLRDDTWPRPADARRWVGVEVLDNNVARLAPYVGRRGSSGEPAPVKIWTSPSGRTLVDRPESRRLAAVHRPRRARAGDHPATQKWSRRPLVAGRCPRTRQPVRPQRPQRLLQPTKTFHGNRYARSPVGPPKRPVSSAWTRSKPSSCTPSCAEPALSSRSRRQLNQLHSDAVWG